MIVGIPKGLLYCRYSPFLNTFFKKLNVEIVTSPDTNKQILDLGSNFCVGEACLPIKIFHGHAAFLRDKCDIIIIPRIMSLKKGESICPEFCGLPEMVLNDIPNMPKAITYPIYASSKKEMEKWILHTGLLFTKNYLKIKIAYKNALLEQKKRVFGINNSNCKLKIALVGHPYNLYDNFANMRIVDKLKHLGIGVITEEILDRNIINAQIKDLLKKPFWTFAKNSYGFSTFEAQNNKVDGIIYVSSFACGIDSIVVELIKNKLDNFPIMVLKIDEHTGEAGFNTRLEAFADMIERRKYV
ncbi:2-hydroxyglutaryl-CoA dehydratase [Clostridium fermenticellae]|uniref:2-hydroxyglutaryl-CoA dehydratase n=1 Tax=Clostridium fermenticellae TaxID=2068654 RepID=A0A386H3J3_9CLOT|nr:acyl-CoA dehydratase activase-related protein [Clostridium fermenticellae]AYD40289.1 2-hydroxyglutaryl-CoA dehydratase [Clostridium fermenticellae]